MGKANRHKRVVQREREAQARFQPFIRILLEREPVRPIFAWALSRPAWTIEVPEEIQRLPYQEELAQVVHLYVARHRKFGGRLFDRSFVGFRYHRSFDERVDFNADGTVARVLAGPHDESLPDLRHRGRSIVELLGSDFRDSDC